MMLLNSNPWLQELIKKTLPEHPDYEGLKKALEEMTQLATYINETKKRSERRYARPAG